MSIEVDPETNPLLTGDDNIGYDEDIEQIEMTSSWRGSVDPTSLHKTYEETSFGGDAIETEKLVDAGLKKIAIAEEIIKRKFPKFNPANSTFTSTLDEFGQVIVRLIGGNAKYYNLFKGNGKLNDKLPKKITDSLGPPVKQYLETLKSQRTKIQAEVDDFNKLKSDETLNEEQKQTIDSQINEREGRVTELESEVEVIEQRMTLRDRVKTICKKYGFTVLAVASAVGVVIGVIVANLKNGLTSLGKGVGNGLKPIGKKLGEILPGLVGAIASFVFRTAGEVIGFLAKNAWLLIVGVVIYLVEQFKKKK